MVGFPNMGFFEPLRYITQFRTVWLAGRYGGGKTALAVELAAQLIEEKFADKVVSNLPLNIGGRETVIKKGEIQDIEDAVLLLDEGWQELEIGSGQKAIKEWLAYLRKQNHYVLLPSVLSLAKEVSRYTIERRFNLLQLGIPYWIYQWRLITGAYTKKDTQYGHIYWGSPTKIFGSYDTEYRPDGQRWFLYDFSYGQGSESGQAE
jgi:hypothetical protein